MAVPWAPEAHGPQSGTATGPATPAWPMWMCAASALPVSCENVSRHMSDEPVSVAVNDAGRGVGAPSAPGVSARAVELGGQLSIPTRAGARARGRRRTAPAPARPRRASEHEGRLMPACTEISERRISPLKHPCDRGRYSDCSTSPTLKQKGRPMAALFAFRQTPEASLTSSRPCRPACRRACRPAPAFSGASATIASVVRMFFAIDAAFCSAERVTIVGSMIPALTRSTYLAGVDVQALALGAVADLVDDDRALEARVVRELAERLLERAHDDRRTRPLVAPRTCRA